MLVKMLKYDLKNVLLMELPFYIFGVIYIGYYLCLKNIIPEESIWYPILFFVPWMALMAGYYVLNKSERNYWRNNIFNDNAYFTYSLPISKKNIYISKFITTLITTALKVIFGSILGYIFLLILSDNSIKIMPIYYILFIIGLFLCTIASDNFDIINNIVLIKMNILNKTAWMVGVLSLIFGVVTYAIGAGFIVKSINFSNDFGIDKVTMEEINNLDMTKWEKSEPLENYDGTVEVSYSPKTENSDGAISVEIINPYIVKYADKSMKNPISIEKHRDWNETEWKDFSEFNNKYIIIFMAYLVVSNVIITTVAYKMFSKGFDII